MREKGFIPKVVIFSFLFLLLLALVLSGCGGKKAKGLKGIEGDPEVLYKQGLALFNKKHYKDALEKFEQLKSSFPDSPPFTVWAEMKVADCHFFLSEYVEAAAAYEDFKKVHPTHEEIAYVQFQIGMSYFKQMTTADRDQTITHKALGSFEYLIANYPPSLFTEKAKERVGTCRRYLAEHEFHIGNFYYREEKFQAAALRFEELLEKYPKWLDQDKTLLLLGKSYVRLDREEKARETLTRLVNEYPKSPLAKEAKTILAKGSIDKKATSRKTKAGPKKSKDRAPEPQAEGIVLVKYEEEGKKAASLKEEKGSEIKKGEERISLPSRPPAEEEKTKPIPPAASKEVKAAPIPAEELPRSLPPARVEPRGAKQPGEGKPKASLPAILGSVTEKDRPKKAAGEEAKPDDGAHPIDITSDTVETYTRENLILFKGNVMARQKDVVIYADSIEAMIIENGKGIERVVAGGNVKVQQGLRVASCRKAVFYNLDKKVVLTGDPKVREGDNVVSGEEIVFDIEQNRIEVKGGTGGRGKVKIYPKGENQKKE